MIGQCLSNKNESATVAKKTKILPTKQGLTATQKPAVVRWFLSTVPQRTARWDGSTRHSGTGRGQKPPSPPCFPAAHPDGDVDTPSADQLLLCWIGTPRVACAHNWLERLGKLPPHPRVLDASVLLPCPTLISHHWPGLLLLLGVLVYMRAPWLGEVICFFGRIKRTSNYITIIPTSILICGG